MIAGIVAITAVSGTGMIFSNFAQSGGAPLPTVDVYRLDGSVPDHPATGQPRELGASPPETVDDAGLRGLASPGAVHEALQAMATRRGVIEQRNVRALITREFKQYDPAYLVHKALRSQRLDALKRELITSEKGSQGLPCSRRMIVEAEWLLHYTAEWATLDRQLTAIERSLGMRDQGFALRQTTDGSWGGCYNAWFARIDATVDFLGEISMPGNGSPPRLQYSLDILRRVDSPQVLIPHLYALQLSQVAKTGVYQREQLNALEGALSQLLFKEKLRALLQANGASFVDQAYVDAYRRFLDDTQDPVLGYWGPWIMSGNEIIRAADLSQTYHTVAYRKGVVNHWPQIIETTLAIKDLPYPLGWRRNGQYSNHNNYDVVRILRLGWSHMTPTEMDQARTEIRGMLKWAVSESITLDGQFRNDLGFSDSVGEAYYYGVSFLAEVGYWNRERRFWDDDPTDYAGAEDLCRKITNQLTRLRTASITVQHALARLNQSCRIGSAQ